MSLIRIILLVLAGLGPALMAQNGSSDSWLNVRRLAQGSPIEVVDHKGASIKGTLAEVSDDSISVAGKKGTVAVPRSEVSRVRVRSSKGRTPTLVGMAIGAGAGLGVGAAAGARLANESGGDFANLKPAIIGVSGAVGALVGAVIGSVAGNRATTVYSAK